MWTQRCIKRYMREGKGREEVFNLTRGPRMLIKQLEQHTKLLPYTRIRHYDRNSGDDDNNLTTMTMTTKLLKVHHNNNNIRRSHYKLMQLTDYDQNDDDDDDDDV